MPDSPDSADSAHVAQHASRIAIASLADGPPAKAQELLASMLAIRFFEEEVQRLFSRNLVRGSTHLCQGQEAVTVGVCSMLATGDTMTCTYRGHGAVLAMGAALDRSFAEILGRAGGLCGGRGGSMHLTDVSIGALGSNAIVGAHLPLTVGAALSAKLLKTGSVSVTFFGDGATNIGAFHESVNLAAIWKLPVLFVIENNQYGEYSPLASTTPISRLADRAASYGIPGVFVDGNDIVSMQAVTRTALERARSGQGPTLIEANTYRQVGHSRSDPAAYRPAGELDRWLAHDPIELLSAAMTAADPDAKQRVAEIRAAVANEVAAAKERALSWPEPDVEDRLKDVYA
jgi:acetoin:2,6-dichlorophenolindophenol oxidoreductase subunit alpha